MRTLYDILKILPTASQEAIETAYQVLAGELLLKMDDGLSLTSQEMKRLRELKGAYSTLSDPEKREKYDRRTGIRSPLPETGLPQAHPTTSWGAGTEDQKPGQDRPLDHESQGSSEARETDPLYQEAIERFLAGDVITASRLFKELEEKLPGEPGPLEMLALCARLSGDQDGAMEFYRRLTQDHSDRLDNFIFLAEIMLEEGLQDEPLDLLEDLAARCEALAALLYGDILAARREEKRENQDDDTDRDSEDESDSDQIPPIPQNPDDPDSGDDREGDEDQDGPRTVVFTTQELEKLSRIPLHDILRILGLSYHLLGDTDAAAECLVEALDYASDTQERVSILSSLMEVYHDAGWIHGVLGAAVELLELEPDNPTPCYGVAVTLFNHNILGPAMTWLKNALKLDPEFEGAKDLMDAINQEMEALPRNGKTLEERIFTSQAQELRRGTVVWFDPVEGAGMAMDGKGRKIFIHYLSLMADSAVPSSGKTVEFAVTRHEGQEVAVGMRVLVAGQDSPDDTVIGQVQSIDLARGFAVVKAGNREILVLHSRLESGSVAVLRPGMRVKCAFVTTSSLADKPLLMATSITPHEA